MFRGRQYCAEIIVKCYAAISVHRSGLGDVAVFENRQLITAAKFINKSSLFILLVGVIRRLELKPNSEQKAENIFIAPPYCQSPYAI